MELKAEIERASALAKQAPRHPQPTPRSGLIAEDPKHREAIKLYEDLTNIIVLNIRSSPGPSKKDEWIFTCCYTHTNESDSVNATTYSMSSSLSAPPQSLNNMLTTLSRPQLFLTFIRRHYRWTAHRLDPIPSDVARKRVTRLCGKARVPECRVSIREEPVGTFPADVVYHC